MDMASGSPAPHTVTLTEEVETTPELQPAATSLEASAGENGVRLLLPVFGFVKLFVSSARRASLATNRR